MNKAKTPEAIRSSADRLLLETFISTVVVIIGVLALTVFDVISKSTMGNAGLFISLTVAALLSRIIFLYWKARRLMQARDKEEAGLALLLELAAEPDSVTVCHIPLAPKVSAAT